MTAQETIIKYLRGRKTGATVPEIVEATGLNANTVRRESAAFKYWHGSPGCPSPGPAMRKCRISGRMRYAYGVQS